MKKRELLQALQTEIRRHDFSTFVDAHPTMANGGPGVVVPGCPACQKRINTMANFMDHLTDDVLPQLFNKVSNRRSGEATNDDSSPKTAGKVPGNQAL
jgi:hypothetical protein